jgi:sporulation protein YunB
MLAFAMILVVAVVFIHSFYRFDRRILPMVLEAAELRIQAEINHIINDVIQEIIQQRQITAVDFIVQGNSAGEGAVLSVNTVLVNDLCNAAAQRISERLNNLEPEEVRVPMGMAFGLDTLAQTGPRFSFSLAPIGNALVNYESSFSAVGINQIHFAVWLTVESVVRIINPVHSSEIVVLRHVSLVDTVISGTVPDTFVNMDVPGITVTP